VKRSFEAGFAAISQRNEGLAVPLAAGFHPEAGIVADTVDWAEDAIDRRKDGVDAGYRLAQSAVVMDEFRAEVAGDLPQMRDLAITPADIEEAAAIKPGFARCFHYDWLLADFAMEIPLAPARHASLHSSVCISTERRLQLDLIKLDF